MALDHDVLNSLRLPASGTPPEPAREVAPAAPWWRRRRALALGALGIALVAFALALGALRNRPLVVETARAEATDPSGRAAVLNASGYVVARRLATVASKVTGRLFDVAIEEGAAVRAGQVLARLDPANAQAAYDLARAQREATTRNLREIEVRLADARRTQARTRELRARGLVAQSAADGAEAEAAALGARLDAARAEVAVADSLLRGRRQDLEDLVIRAPFAGVVIAKDAQPGETVSPISAGGGFTRTGIATIVDMDSREIEVDVNEAFINRVAPGQPAEAALDAYPGEAFAARVINVVPAADRQKATVKVRIAFERLDARILPDMGVKVRFLAAPAPGAPRARALVPGSAIVRDGPRAYVWRVAAGRVARREVVLGASQGDAVGVVGGIEPGDVVVARPAATLADGARVEPKAG